MILNGIYVAAVVACIFGAVVLGGRALAADRLWLTLQNLDDEELAAFLTEYPDVLDWKGWR
jgi:hypothetical protein